MGQLILRLGLTCALGAGCLWSPASSAAADPATRPRICLVLSGGGARGMAHIGVLKVLEDLKIPIDCIAGTSMGAIVGGLYASGMTAIDIDATMRSLDWQEAFRDAPPRRDLAFRRKQDDRNFLVRLPLGLKHAKILLPKGFIQGQKLQETLRQLTLPFSNSTDFDLLPTPFRAVATDLETGNAVVMDKGDLAIAMRASMSAPGVFAPVELNGRLLVDGGLAENLPVNVARAMHADILIVSDVSFPLQQRAALDSAISISNQMLAILVRKDSDRQRASLSPQDILIEPNLGSAPATDFASPSAVIARGENAAREAIAKLSAYAVGDNAYRDYSARRAAREPGLPPIKFVRVDEQSKRYEKTILAEMQPLVGKPLDLDQVGKRITELYGLGNFETLDYSLVEQGQGAGEETGLEVRARRKSWGPNYVRFGLNLEDDFQGNSRYNAAERAHRGARSADLHQKSPGRRLSRPRGGSRSRRRIQPRQLGRNPRRSPQNQRPDPGAPRRPDTGGTAVQQRRVFFQVQLRSPGQRTFPARRRDVQPAVGRQPHQSGRRHRVRQGNGRLVGGEFARTQHDIVLDLGRDHAGRQLQTERLARILLPGWIFQFVGSCPRFADRPALRDRPRDLLSQNRPRRRGLLRVSRLSRRVARARQYLAAPRRHELFVGAQGCVAVRGVRHLSRARIPRIWVRHVRNRCVLPVSRPEFLGFPGATRRIYGVEATPNFHALRATFNGVEATPPELEISALGEFFYFFEHQRGLVADSRIFMLTRHVFHDAVAFCRGEKPVRLLPVGAQQFRERISRFETHANAVRTRQHRQSAHQILNVCDSHGPRKIAESRVGCQLIRRG